MGVFFGSIIPPPVSISVEKWGAKGKEENKRKKKKSTKGGAKKTFARDQHRKIGGT